MTQDPSLDLTKPVSEADHAFGPHDAAVTIVEYGDFECPNCKQAAPALKLLLERFAGRVCLVYRHFPLEEVHPHALLAAEAAEAAAVQGAFWKMHDLLFANQGRLQQPRLHDYAAQLGLDLKRYNSEMAGHVHAARVREHEATGRDSGVRGTPGIFLNGKLHDVSFGFDSLERAVVKALQG